MQRIKSLKWKTDSHAGGVMFFPFLIDMEVADKELVFAAYDKIPVEARIIANPKADNYIFLCNLPNAPDSWGGNFRCFLYKDVPKILGTFTYFIEAARKPEKIDGTYKMTDEKFSASGMVLLDGKAEDGFYMEFERVS
jgi:hypothetical protein